MEPKFKVDEIVLLCFANMSYSVVSPAYALWLHLGNLPTILGYIGRPTLKTILTTNPLYTEVRGVKMWLKQQGMRLEKL